MSRGKGFIRPGPFHLGLPTGKAAQQKGTTPSFPSISQHLPGNSFFAASRRHPPSLCPSGFSTERETSGGHGRKQERWPCWKWVVSRRKKKLELESQDLLLSLDRGLKEDSRKLALGVGEALCVAPKTYIRQFYDAWCFLLLLSETHGGGQD